MKLKRIFYMFLIFLLVVILAGYFTIRNLTTTSYGKIDLIYGVMSKIESHFNPILFKGKSIDEMRSDLHKVSTKWQSLYSPLRGWYCKSLI
jgi:acetyl esterase